MRQCSNKNLNQIEALLTRYGFEIKGVAIAELIEKWAASYSVYWIRLAIVEALYQGRYKAISVEHILALWKRLGHPTYHFTYEFERFITRNVFIEEGNNHKIVQQQPPEEKPSNRDAIAETVPKNNITLTPIQELVKKIAIPFSIASKNLNGKREKIESLNEATEQTVVTENLVIDQPKIASPTLLKPEKTPRTINQFVPHSDASDFYGKLKAVAYQQLEENQDI
ncbi:hypothetical protein [Crocosphaera sp.]|uniref:hypothetical protein n=1 Tax=Crocosphaera sp. TaxID=2729996 RepID=UPI003F1ED325|nr:hypothetical protein [Crocosphaera sp.]